MFKLVIITDCPLMDEGSQSDCGLKLILPFCLGVKKKIFCNYFVLTVKVRM